MKATLAAVLTAVLALALSSCGGGNDDAAASKSLSSSIMKSQKSASGAAQLLTLKQKEADCIGSGLVDKIGTDQLKKYGLLTKDNKANKGVTQAKMSTADAKAATGVLFGCTDVPAMMKTAISSSGQVPPAMQKCITTALNETALRGMFTHVFTGDQKAAQQDLIGPMTKCATGSGG